MVTLQDMKDGLKTRREVLLHELALVKLAIMHRADEAEPSQLPEAWFEKLCRWRDELEALLHKLPEQKA